LPRNKTGQDNNFFISTHLDGFHSFSQWMVLAWSQI
jgi:hypothetical protein